jgi:two-component sensor histidine kinase
MAAPGVPSRAVLRRLQVRASVLLILAALLLPVFLIPLSHLVPTLWTEAGQLTRQASAAASRVATALARQAEALQRVENSLLAGLPEEPGEAARRIAGLTASEPALRGAVLSERGALAGRPALLTGRLLRAEPDPAMLAAALRGPAQPGSIRLDLLAPDGEVLARSTEHAVTEQAPILAVRQPVEGWPLLVLATRSVAPPASTGLLSVGAAVLAMLLLALLAYRREQRGLAAAAAEERREAQRNASLAESAARLRLALGAAELGCWSWDEATDDVSWDARAATILGWHPFGQVPLAALRDRLEPGDHAVLEAALSSARRSGEPTPCALRLRPLPGGAPRWIELRAQAWRGPRGTLFHGVISDITARRGAEEQQQRLLREVDHRAKNTLAVVQALLRLTRAEDPAGFLPRVEARIAALARAHTLLAQSRWQGAALHRLVVAEFQRRRPGEGAPMVALAGPPVLLSPLAAQPMAMVLHELASNALQFGGLAQPGGTLSLSWQLLPEGGLELTWQERRPAPPPAGVAPVGFGTRILEATVRDQLGGRISREWRAEGLRCIIRLPAGCVVAAPPEAVAERAAAEPSVSPVC